MITLITKSLEAEFAAIGTQAETLNPVLVARYYNPSGAGEWYPIEYDPKIGEFFGYVIGFPYNDWHVFTLRDLKTFKGRNGACIQRDPNFRKTHFEDMPRY